MLNGILSSGAFLKNFVDWFRLKPNLDQVKSRLSFKEREVWFVYFGINVGFELDGKTDYLRPCLIVKKLSKETFLAIPLTSKPKNGSWYFPSFVQNLEGRYIFSQIRLFDAKRLKYFVETINEKEFRNIKQNFISFFMQ